jgi:hypothetical protein
MMGEDHKPSAAGAGVDPDGGPDRANDTGANGGLDRVWLAWLQRWLVPHRLAAAASFLVLAALFALADLISADVLALTGMVLLAGVLAHQFTIRALAADDEWVADRARRVAARSYERGNIDGVLADRGREPIWRRKRPTRKSNPPPPIAKKS